MADKKTNEDNVSVEEGREDYMDAYGYEVEGGATQEDIDLDRETSRIYMEQMERIKEEYNLTDEQIEAVLNAEESEED